MRLVDDDDVRARQQLTETRVLQRQICKQQMMVYHDDVGGLRLTPRLDDEAIVEVLAAHTEAIVDGRADPRLQAVTFGQIMELGQIAARARARPALDSGEVVQPRRIAELSLLGQHETVPTQIVGSPLEKRNRQRATDCRAERGQIACEELVLQCLRASRDHGLATGQQHRGEIRERLTDSGPGLDDEMRPILQRLPD